MRAILCFGRSRGGCQRVNLPEASRSADLLEAWAERLAICEVDGIPPDQARLIADRQLEQLLTAGKAGTSASAPASPRPRIRTRS